MPHEALTVATANGTELNFAEGSIIVDPWRKPDIKGVQVERYGNTRKNLEIIWESPDIAVHCGNTLAMNPQGM